MGFRLALAQFAPSKGDLASNSKAVARLARQASGEGADLVVFPESALTGYILEGGADEAALDRDGLVSLLGARLVGVPPLDLVVGFYEATDGQPANSAAYLVWDGSGCRALGVYRKFFLPTYGVFDEERFHQRGARLGLFDTRFGKVGILICEDVWHSVLGMLLAMNGAEVVLVPSASPVRGLAEERPGNVMRYERMLRGLSEEHGVYSAAAMLTGFEGGKGFSGGSMAFDPFGTLLAQAPLGEEALVVFDVDLGQVRLARSRTPLLGDLKSSWEIIQRLVAETEP
jgi:predicted amidohydrolase